MAPVLGLFSSPNSASSEETTKLPKPRRGSNRPPAPKKPPQRGLGVAQLERIRLQERWKMLSQATDSPAFSRFSGSWIDAAPPKSSVPHAFPALVYLPRCRSGIQIPATFPPLEPPSSQTSSLCFSAQCEFCVRKKRLFGEDPVSDFFEMQASSGISDEAELSGQYWISRPIKSARESELKEFDFFPKSISSSTADHGSEFAGASAGVDASSPCFVDLSLTL